MFNIIAEINGSLTTVTTVPNAWLIAGVVIVALVLCVFYALRGVGLYVLAKKSQGDEKKIAFLAWIPIAWIYLAGKLAGKVIMFGKRIEKFALILTIVFSVAEVFNIVYYALTYIPLIGYFLSGGTVGIFIGSSSQQLTVASFEAIGYTPYLLDSTFFVSTEIGINYPYANIVAMMRACYVMSYVSAVISLISLVVTIFMYIGVLKRYYPKHFVLATILCIWLGIFPIFAFIIRNRKPINYNDYLRERYNHMYNNPYGPNSPYNNPYATNNPNDPRYNQPRQPESPFEEFADKKETDPGDPFADFFNGDKDDKDGKD